MAQWFARAAWFLAGAALTGGVALANGSPRPLTAGILYGAQLQQPITIMCTDAENKPVASRPPPTTAISLRYAGGDPGVVATITCR